MKISGTTLIRLVGWTTGSFALTQLLRFTTNVILARILAPELFGIMLIVNSVRTGIDLISDIGVGQNLVTNADAEDPELQNTAWTLQVLRGAILCTICSTLAFPLAWFYEAPILAGVLPAASLYFVFTGLSSTSRFMLQKKLVLARITVFDVLVTFISAVAHIFFALLDPTIWSLVYGGVVASAASMVSSYFLVPGVRHRLRLSKRYAQQIFSFGKWITLSSIIYFLSMNFDRLYLGTAISLELLGVYAIARTIADTLSLLGARLSTMVVFPLIAASATLSRAELRQQFARTRLRSVLSAAAGVALFVATADLLIPLLYDERYHAAAVILPMLIVGAWFSVICTINESTLLGIAKPVYGAIANTVKLGWLLLALPLAIAWYGLTGAVFALALGDCARYVPILLSQVRERISFVKQDVLATFAMLLMAGTFKALLWAIGLGGGFESLPGGK